MKKKVILSSVLSIVLCLSLICGATFALFTDTETVNIAVTSGKVDIEATVLSETIKVGSYDSATNGTVWKDEGVTTFTNGGAATFTEGTNTLAIDRVTPGDVVEFTIRVTNRSNVGIKYRTKLAVTEGADLFSALNVTMVQASETAATVNDDETTASAVYNGRTYASDWTALGAAPENGEVISEVVVTVELPYSSEDQNHLMDLNTVMAYTVEAVQGNASEEDLEAIENGETYIYSAMDLMILANNVNNLKNNYAGETVILMNDIDLEGMDWTPIGGNASLTHSQAFKGTFDGDGKTIKNLNVNNDGWAGLFGYVHASSGAPASIKNLTLDGVRINSSRMAGAIVGQLYGSLDNCHVKNAEIVVVPNYSEDHNTATKYDNGDKVGGLVGWMGDNSNERTLTNCSATNVYLKAYRDVGGLAGYVANGTTVTDNKATGITIVADQATNAYGDKDYNAGGIVGRRGTNVTETGSTETNVKISYVVANETALIDALSVPGNTVCVEAGTYELTSALNIAKGVTLIGLGDVEIVRNNITDTTTGVLSGRYNSVTVKNVTFSGKNAARWTELNGTAFENCVFDGTTYGFHIDSGESATFKDCTFSGFNAFGGSVALTMENCTFVANRSSYNGINLWGNTTLTGCTFVFDGSASTEWIDVRGSNKTVTVTNCVVTDGTTVAPVKNVLGVSDTGNTIIVDGETLNIVSDVDTLADALTNGNDVVLGEDVTVESNNTAPYGNTYALAHNGGTFDGNGNTVSATGSGDTYAVMTSGGTIKNLNVDSGFRGIMIMYPTEDIVLDNVSTKGDAIYGINTGEISEEVKLIVTNSEVYGWTSYSNLVSASFTDCTFGGNAYAVLKPYVETTITGCTFEKDFWMDTTALGNNGEDPDGDEYKVIDADATITLTNCYCDGVLLTAENYSQYITIEKGPTGHVVINGVTLW